MRKSSSKIGYMCAVSYAYELDKDNSTSVEVFGSIEALKDNLQCAKECGIIKVRVTLESWEDKGDYKWSTTPKKGAVAKLRKKFKDRKPKGETE